MNFTVPPKMAVVDVDGAYTNIPYYLTIGSISSCFYYDDYNRLKISNLSKKDGTILVTNKSQEGYYCFESINAITNKYKHYFIDEDYNFVNFQNDGEFVVENDIVLPVYLHCGGVYVDNERKTKCVKIKLNRNHTHFILDSEYSLEFSNTYMNHHNGYLVNFDYYHRSEYIYNTHRKSFRFLTKYFNQYENRCLVKKARQLIIENITNNTLPFNIPYYLSPFIEIDNNRKIEIEHLDILEEILNILKEYVVNNKNPAYDICMCKNINDYYSICDKLNIHVLEHSYAYLKIQYDI